MRIAAVVLIVMSSLCVVALAQSRPSSAPSKMPMPTTAKVEEAKTVIKDLFKNEYVKKDRVAISTGLVSLVSDSNDATRFAARLLLIDMALGGCGDYYDESVIFEQLRLLGNTFDIPSDVYGKMVADALNKIVGHAHNKEQLVKYAFDFANGFIDADQYDNAKSVARIAVIAAQNTNDASLTKAAGNLVIDIRDIEAAYKTVRVYQDRLTTAPSDETANTEVGKFLCFYRGNWKSGLLKLVEGKDVLKGLATDEIRADNAAAKVAVADKWLEYAKTMNLAGRAKASVEGHAAGLYAAALPGLDGIEKLKTEKKLKALPKPTNMFDLLANLELKGKGWSLKNGEATSDSSRTSLTLKGGVAGANGDYRLVVRFTRLTGTDTVFVTVPVADQHVDVIISGWFGTWHGLERIDGREAKDANNPTRVAGKLANGQKYSLTVCTAIQPDKTTAHIVVFLDDKKLVDWTGKISTLSSRFGHQKKGEVIILFADSGIIHSAELYDSD